MAILATDGFEQVELTQPRNAIQDAGGKAFVVSLQPGTILGVNHMEKGETVQVDKTLGAAKAEDFDGLIIPGGLYNPDALRANRDAVNFVRDFFKQSKPVAAICHGPWLLVEADVVTGRTLTSYPNIKTDIRNAGGNWIDEEVVCDEGLVTSRSPDDLDAFCEKAVEEFAEGRHAGQTT
ncbi:MAG: type 1 glutamine amidotransferase domain-containing protein [Phycisphaerae bacterium]